MTADRQNDPDHLARLLSVAIAGSARGSSCPDDETVAALTSGSLDAGDRRAALAHLSECSLCRSAVSSIVRALATRDLGRAMPASSQPLWRRVVPIALPAAAAATIVLVFAMPQDTDRLRESSRVPLLTVPIESLPPHRAPTILLGSAPVPTSPLGSVPAVYELRWGAVDGADRYRVTVFDEIGSVVFETELDGLMATLPDSVGLVPGERYLWKVEARLEFDRWTASELVEFHVATPRRP